MFSLGILWLANTHYFTSTTKLFTLASLTLYAFFTSGSISLHTDYLAKYRSVRCTGWLFCKAVFIGVVTGVLLFPSLAGLNPLYLLVLCAALILRARPHRVVRLFSSNFDYYRSQRHLSLNRHLFRCLNAFTLSNLRI